MELINTNATAYDSWLSANMCSLRKAIEHLEEPNTNDIIEVTGRMIWQAATAQAVPEGFVLVPMQPTPRMIDATWNCDEEIQNMSHNSRNEFIYKAMIEAQEQSHD